jgi:hypothetical protein
MCQRIQKCHKYIQEIVKKGQEFRIKIKGKLNDKMRNVSHFFFPLRQKELWSLAETYFPS